MSKKKEKNINVNNRSAKKAVVLGAEKKSRIPLIIIFAFVFIVLSGAFSFYLLHGKNKVAATAPSTITANSSAAIFPVSLFNDGKARHFEYKDNDITIRYFILKSSDGIVRAAFDACDVCWPAGKGYYQEGDTMVCRNCGRRFASVLVNEVQGGCNPAPLNRRVSGDKLVIQADDILEGKQYFNFSGKV